MDIRNKVMYKKIGDVEYDLIADYNTFMDIQAEMGNLNALIDGTAYLRVAAIALIGTIGRSTLTSMMFLSTCRLSLIFLPLLMKQWQLSDSSVRPLSKTMKPRPSPKGAPKKTKLRRIAGVQN